MSEYKNHPYNNHVIKVKTREHGAKVIEWWVNQGVEDANVYKGNNTEEEGNKCIYYGLYDGIFTNCEVNKASLYKIIELPEDSSPISPPSTKKEVVKDNKYYKSFENMEVVGIDKFDDERIFWNPDMKNFLGQKGFILHYDDFRKGFLVEFYNGMTWNYPADLIIQQLESITTHSTEIKIPAVQKVSTEIKPDLSKKIPEIKVSLPEVKPKQIGRVLIEKVSIKI